MFKLMLSLVFGMFVIIYFCTMLRTVRIGNDRSLTRNERTHLIKKSMRILRISGVILIVFFLIAFFIRYTIMGDN